MNATSHHPIVYSAPPLTSEDDAVLGEIHAMRKDLRHVLRTPQRWEGVLRRSALARNIQGSNSIEGYQVAEDDAATTRRSALTRGRRSPQGRGRHYTADEPSGGSGSIAVPSVSRCVIRTHGCEPS